MGEYFCSVGDLNQGDQIWTPGEKCHNHFHSQQNSTLFYHWSLFSMSPLRWTSEIPLALLGETHKWNISCHYFGNRLKFVKWYSTTSESRHILGGDFRLFQSRCHLSFLRNIKTNNIFKMKADFGFSREFIKFIASRFWLFVWSW